MTNLLILLLQSARQSFSAVEISLYCHTGELGLHITKTSVLVVTLCTYIHTYIQTYICVLYIRCTSDNEVMIIYYLIQTICNQAHKQDSSFPCSTNAQ